MQYVLCICNNNYLASLETRKVYCALPDEQAAQKNLIRIIDESEEDYLYPANYFVSIQLPQLALATFAAQVTTAN